jgi:hypothetical protein
VARTKRIPVEERAEAAVMVWMRHQTTGQDGRVIPRIKGKRREVRRLPARRSHELLKRYRRGEPIPETCPLMSNCSRAEGDRRAGIWKARMRVGAGTGRRMTRLGREGGR